MEDLHQWLQIAREGGQDFQVLAVWALGPAADSLRTVVQSILPENSRLALRGQIMFAALKGTSLEGLTWAERLRDGLRHDLPIESLGIAVASARQHGFDGGRVLSSILSILDEAEREGEDDFIVPAIPVVDAASSEIIS
jgi:hypothetical protein